jgi:hypothetical protein
MTQSEHIPNAKDIKNFVGLAMYYLAMSFLLHRVGFSVSATVLISVGIRVGLGLAEED